MPAKRHFPQARGLKKLFAFHWLFTFWLTSHEPDFFMHCTSFRSRNWCQGQQRHSLTTFFQQVKRNKLFFVPSECEILLDSKSAAMTLNQRITLTHF